MKFLQPCVSKCNLCIRVPEVHIFVRNENSDPSKVIYANSHVVHPLSKLTHTIKLCVSHQL